MMNREASKWAKILLPVLGLLSLAWFLLRVIPNPSRATYPCMLAAFPLASTFVVWLLGLMTSAFLIRKARKGIRESRFILAGICGIAAAGFTTKDRDWNAVEVLEVGREAWAQDANLALELAGHGERIDHRALAAQRIEALELAHVAQEQGHEAEALEHTVRAVALDRPPLPQLSAGAWQLKERGQEVAAVRVWHEVKAHAAEVARVAQELAGHVRTWLERAADHVLDRLQPPEAGLAYEGGGHDRDRPQDLAARMREAWALRDQRSDIGDQRSAISEKTSDKSTAPQSLADRLRAGSTALDHDEIAARPAATRQ